MIKNLTGDNILTVPFTVTKKWEIDNNSPIDYLLYESGSYNCPIAYSYINYNDGNYAATENTSSVIGIFYDNVSTVDDGIAGNPEISFSTNELTNVGHKKSYKSLVYDSIYNTFYNSYIDPLEKFGLNNIDLIKDGSIRTLSDSFTMFSINSLYLGDNIKQNSVCIKSTLTDQYFEIVDDGQSNLISDRVIFTTYQCSRNFS